MEALGRETFIGVDVGSSRIAIYEEGRSALQPGDEVGFGIRPDGLRLFDAARRALAMHRRAVR